MPVVIVANITGGDYRNWPGYIGWGEAGAAAGLAVVVYQGSTIAEFDMVLESRRQGAGTYHIDLNRIVIWCGSANVRLGLLLAMDAKRDYIRGAVAYYGDADVAIRTDLPVFLVRAGLDSPELNERVNGLAAKALAANAPWIIENDTAGYHGFEVLNDDEVSRAIIGRTFDFIRSVTRPEISKAYATLSADAALGAAFARGEWPAAVTGYRRKVAADPKDAEAHRRLGLALMGTKQYAAALEQFEAAWNNGRRGPRDTALPAARAAALAGNVAKSIEWLRIVYATRFAPTIAELQADAAFASVRDDPAFVELVKSLGAR